MPIHAYPVANETLFPARVDFGRAAVGEEVVRRHTLECKVRCSKSGEAGCAKGVRHGHNGLRGDSLGFGCLGCSTMQAVP